MQREHLHRCLRQRPGRGWLGHVCASGQQCVWLRVLLRERNENREKHVLLPWEDSQSVLAWPATYLFKRYRTLQRVVARGIRISLCQGPFIGTWSGS